MTVETVSSAKPPGPLVSVVIPAHNAGPYLRETLESVTRQETAFPFEIVLIDDGSTDDTLAQARTFEEVRIVRESGRGPSAARNRGIAEARGEYVAFLDADDLWPPEKLATQVAIFQSHPELGLVVGDCRIFTDAGSRPRTQFEEQGLDTEFFGGDVVIEDPYARLFRVNFVPTGAAVVRRTCLEKAGLFDESRRYVEDLDLWFRIALHCKIGYTRRICELKREHAGGLSANRERMTLAFIDVLAAQATNHPEELNRRGLRVKPRIAFEYCLIGDARERQGDFSAARSRYLQAFRTHPSLRPLYYWLQSWTRQLLRGSA
jgi:glycosyltransferase involved in cell wall biosynthesis